MFNLFLSLIFFSSLLLNGSTQNVYSTTTFMQVPDPPLFSCPYQEDLISSIQFLRDQRTPRKRNIENLMDLMKASPRKVVKRKNKDEIRIEPKPHTPDVRENHSMDLNFTAYNETESSKDEPIIVERRVKKVLTPIQNIPQSNNEQKMLEILKQTFDIDNKSQKSTTDHTYTNQKVEWNGDYQNELPTNLLPNTEQTHNIYNQENANSAKNNKPVFNIPYQRVSDILEESAFLIPEEAYCDNSNWISDSKLKQQAIKSDPHNSKAMKNAIICSESDETVAMLFKPKTISLMQVCDNLLKKITVTVLVPHHVSKIDI